MNVPCTHKNYFNDHLPKNRSWECSSWHSGLFAWSRSCSRENRSKVSKKTVKSPPGAQVSQVKWYLAWPGMIVEGLLLVNLLMWMGLIKILYGILPQVTIYSWCHLNLGLINERTIKKIMKSCVKRKQKLLHCFQISHTINFQEENLKYLLVIENTGNKCRYEEDYMFVVLCFKLLCISKLK